MNPLRRIWRAFAAIIPPRIAERAIGSYASVLAERDDTQTALRRIFALDDHVQRELDRLAIRLDGGIHAKHRLIRYHDFFVDRTRAGEKVLDIGAGKGELAYDLATRAGALVTGIDLKKASLEFARTRHMHPNVRFLEGDVLHDLPQEHFDVVVLSNVLEHLEPRVELLRTIAEQLGPRAILIRVPAENRHWQVPLRRELGLQWFNEPSHVLEYDRERFMAEMEAAGLEIAELDSRWGELWADVRPAHG